MSGTLSEHYNYLCESRRIDLYRAAVRELVQPGDTVADLGCGFGILGLLCLEAGAAKVWGIDSTDAIAIARETIDREGFEDRYECVRARTFQAQLPEPVDVLICDHVGYFGVDYGIVAMLDDARRRFLKPGGRVIPRALHLQIAGISSSMARDTLGAWRKQDMPAQYGWLTDYAINTKHNVNFSDGDVLAPAVPLGSVDLMQDSAASLNFAVTLIAPQSGALDGLGGWFSCDLAPGVLMTNAPGAPGRIRRSQVLLGFEEPLAVEAGDDVEVNVRIRHEDVILSWSARNLRTGQQARHSTWAGMPIDAMQRMRPGHEIRELSDRGKAALAVLALADGSRSGADVEAEMLRTHAALFPSPEELVRFVRSELARNTQ